MGLSSNSGGMASRRLALLVLAGLSGLAQGVNPLLGGVVPNATICTGCELCQFLLKKGKEPGFEQAACPKKGPDQVPGELAENGDAVDNACVARLHTLGKQCFALNATGCCNRQDPRETLNNFTVRYVVDDFAWPVLRDEAAMRNFTSAFATDVQQALRTNATVVVNDVRFPVPQTMASPAVLGSVEFSLLKADQRDFIAALSVGNSEVNAIPFSRVRSTFGRLPLASAILKKDGLPSSIEVPKKMAKRVITETVQTDLLRLNVNPEWVNDNMMKFQEALRTDIAAQTGAEESDVTIHNVNATNNATVVDVSLRGNQTIGDKQIKLTSLEAETGEVVPVEYVGASEAEVVSDVQTRSKSRDKTPVLLPPSHKHQHDPVRMEIKVRLAPAWIADSFNRNASTNITYDQFAKQLSFDLSIALRRVKNWDLATELDQQMSDLKSLVYRGVYSTYVDSTFDVDMPESPLSLKEQRAKARAKAEKARMDFIEKTGGNSSLSVSVSGSKTFVVRGAESRRCTNKNGGCDADALCIEAWSAGSHWPNNWCECNAGFEGDGFTCAPINPCVEAEGMVGTQCGPDSTCLSYAPGRAKCVCNSGYSGDGLYCAEIDNCKFGNGGCARPGGICTKTGPGSSVCHCDNGVDSFPFDNKAKYVGNGTYREPYNPCKVNNGNCEKTAVCVFEGKPRKSHCECAPGYASNKKSLAKWTKVANAPENTTSLKLFCAPVNLCETDAHNCSVHAACRPRAPGKATCLCNAGYHGDGKTCRPADLCKFNNGGCDTTSSQCVKSGAGRNICECKRGFSKAPSGQCFAHSVCSSEKNPCHRNAKCADTAPGEYTCTCAKGFTGDGKYNCDPVMPCNFATKIITKCSDFSVCMMNPKPERDAGNLARCECLPGYQSAGTGSCVPVRRCDQINATGCHDNATCVNWGPGRRACICN